MKAEFKGRKVVILEEYDDRLKAGFVAGREEMNEEVFQEDLEKGVKYLLSFRDNRLAAVLQYRLPADDSGIGKLLGVWKHPDYRDEGRQPAVLYFLIKAEGMRGLTTSTPTEELADKLARDGGPDMHWKKTGEDDLYTDIDMLPEEEIEDVPI